MKLHRDCEKECQQAVDYGVWPERSCSPKCVWLSREETKEAIGETIARVVHRQQSHNEPHGVTVLDSKTFSQNPPIPSPSVGQREQERGGE